MTYTTKSQGTDRSLKLIHSPMINSINSVYSESSMEVALHLEKTLTIFIDFTEFNFGNMEMGIDQSCHLLLLHKVYVGLNAINVVIRFRIHLLISIKIREFSGEAELIYLKYCCSLVFIEIRG